MNRCALTLSGNSTWSGHVRAGRIRNTQSDYVTGGEDLLFLTERRRDARRDGVGRAGRRCGSDGRTSLERHMDTFSDELELLEPTTVWGRFLQSVRRGGALHPQSYWHLGWLLLVSACFAYNCVVIPLRSTFPYQTPSNRFAWFLCDLAADGFYLLDLLLVKPHVIFLYDGFWVREKELTRSHYFAKWQFKLDILSLVPLDLLYLIYGPDQVLFRLPRVLKIQTFWELFDHLDSLLMSPYLVRVARTLFYMMYLVHLNACAYYAFSAREGLGTNNWTFAGGDGNAYIRCFYFATKTATSVGKNPRPETVGEYLFMTCSWLMGVFVFALLIGQIRDIVATATRTRTEYRQRLDETLEHMRRLNLPEAVQRRVQSWFTFTAQHQPFDEGKILNSLPQKLKTDVAIDVHGVTLSKVQLFQKIADQALIRELVLKLRSVLYLPGDYICRKDEVGKEMYIVKTGQVEVLDPTGGEVLATLGEGSVFGEISLLALAGGNRRTADVRSKGFSNLFVLSKNDLNETLVYYPDAQKILKQKAEELVRENEERARRERRTSISSSEDCLDSSSEDSSGGPAEAGMTRPAVTIGVTVSATPSPPNDCSSPSYEARQQLHQTEQLDQLAADTYLDAVDPATNIPSSSSSSAEAAGRQQQSTEEQQQQEQEEEQDQVQEQELTQQDLCSVTLTSVTLCASTTSISSGNSDQLGSGRFQVSTLSGASSPARSSSDKLVSSGRFQVSTLSGASSPAGSSPCRSPSDQLVSSGRFLVSSPARSPSAGGQDDEEAATACSGSGDTLSDLSTASIMSPAPTAAPSEWWRRPSVRSEMCPRAPSSPPVLQRRRVSAPNPISGTPTAVSAASVSPCELTRTDSGSSRQRKRGKLQRNTCHSHSAK